MIHRDCDHLSLKWNLNMDGDICNIFGMIVGCDNCKRLRIKGKNVHKPITANSCKIEALEHLVKLKDDYIGLLVAEISDLMGFNGLSIVQGWKSSRVKEGEEVRQKIADAKKTIEEI